MIRSSRVRLLALAGAALLVTGCKPTAEDIELALGAYGLSQPQAQCLGQGLEPLQEEDWRVLGGLAGEVMKGEEGLRAMTLGEVEARLRTLDNPRLVGTVVRTGLGCMMLHGEFALPLDRGPGLDAGPVL